MYLTYLCNYEIYLNKKRYYYQYHSLEDTAGLNTKYVLNYIFKYKFVYKL